MRSRFISFFARKLKFGCFVKLISSLVIILIIILVYKWRKQSNGFETEEIKVFGDTLESVAMAQGVCYHIFGDKDEIELISPLWEKLHDTKVKYYIAHSQEISKESESSIVYYDEKDTANILDNYEIIYKNINRKEQWHIVINPTIVVNKTAIHAELNRYKWYHPILLTFHGDTRGIEDKLELILSQSEVSVVSTAMLDKLQRMKDLEFEEIVREIRTHWVSYKMQTLEKSTDPTCSPNTADCQLQSSLVYKLTELQLLPHLLLRLVRSEQKRRRPQMAEAAREYSAALNLIPHKYLHEVSALYDREEGYGLGAAGTWDLMDLPPECRQLGTNCYLSSILRNTMPISHTGNQEQSEWKIVRAYSKFSLRSWAEYLILAENVAGYKYLLRIVNKVDPKSGRAEISEINQGRLILVQVGDYDPINSLEDYHILLRQQEACFTSTRYPMLFSIHLVIVAETHRDGALTQKLETVREEFPEVYIDFINKEKASSSLLDILTRNSPNDIVLVNTLKQVPKYSHIEKCYSQTRFGLKVLSIPGSNETVCVTVQDCMQALRRTRNTNPISSVSTLFPHLKAIRFLKD